MNEPEVPWIDALVQELDGLTERSIKAAIAHGDAYDLALRTYCFTLFQWLAQVVAQMPDAKDREDFCSGIEENLRSTVEGVAAEFAAAPSEMLQ